MSVNNGKSRLLKYIAAILTILGILLLLFINSGLAGFANWVYPGAVPWAHALLLIIEAVALLWFWRGVFGRHQHLLALDHPNPEERLKFAEELARRMRGNSHIIAYQAENPGSLDHADPAYLDQCLFILGLKADDEIRQTSKRIFLATALSQNGRLDALIVFASLCRMVWRISSVYNQRPHPREVLALYSAVISSTFIALSLEELDIATEITVGFSEAFNATAPASITASIPFAGSALQTFTASTIDGAANCYLALRAGIITRNAYAYGPKATGWPSRAVVYKEAGGMLLGMSQELVGKVASALAGKLAGLARYAQNKTVQAGKGLVSGIGDGAAKLADGTISIAQNTGKGIKKAGAYSGNMAGRAAKGTAKAAAWPFRMAARPFRRKGREKKI